MNKSRKRPTMHFIFSLLALMLSVAAVCAESPNALPVPPVVSKVAISDRDTPVAQANHGSTTSRPTNATVSKDESATVPTVAADRPSDETEASKWTDPILWFTLVIAVANIFLWRATSQAASAAEKSAEAARKGAAATASAVEQSKDTATRQLRAYVYEHVDRSGLRIVGNRHYQAEVEIKNAGMTPAYEVDGWVNMAFLSEDEAMVFAYQNIRQPVNQGRFVVNPGTVHTLGTGVIKGAGDDEKTLYLWGEIRYEDAFGNARCTKFRLFDLQHEGVDIWGYCPAGNEAD